VIEALEGDRVSLWSTLDKRSTMWACVEEGVNFSLPVTIEDQLLAADVTRDEVVGFSDLGVVTEVEPASIEDAIALAYQDLVLDKRSAGHPKNSLVAIIDDHRTRFERAI